VKNAAMRHRSFWKIRTVPSRTLALASIAVFCAATALAQSPPKLGEKIVKFETTARPINGFDSRDPSRREFGELEFRGGIEISSNQQGFGGFSALRVSPDGTRFISISDRGRWLRGKIIYEGTRPSRISDLEMAPMLGANGIPLAVQGWFDTESLAEDGGILYVGIERVNQIVRFDYGKDGLLARGQPIAVPPEIKSLPYNKGLEAMAFVPKDKPLGGTLIAISERGLDENGNILGFLIGGPSPGKFAFTRSSDFEITDAAITPGGDLLILERSFSLLRGAGMRIRRVPLAQIKPGAVIVGSVVFEADRNYDIDNMEGLSVHRGPEGETVLTLISDDNFNPLQRTILLQFTLKR
jgi:hypothetical protein